MEGWEDGRMEGWKDGRMEGWKDGRMEGWMRYKSVCTDGCIIYKWIKNGFYGHPLKQDNIADNHRHNR